MKFGVYVPVWPDASADEREANLDLLAELDPLGFDCAWIGVPPGGQHAGHLMAGFIDAATRRCGQLQLGICFQDTDCREAFPPTEVQLDPAVDLAIGTQVSPAGARLAGMHGTGMVSTGATTPGGFNALPVNWEVYERCARKYHHVPDRQAWAIAGPMHVAESRRQAVRNTAFGLDTWTSRLEVTAGVRMVPTGQDAAACLSRSGIATIGSPRDAVSRIRELQAQSGGFGSFLFMAHQWADPEATRKHYQLIADRVMPAFRKEP